MRIQIPLDPTVGKFELTPPGVYDLLIQSAEVTPSKREDGYPQIKVQAQIVNGANTTHVGKSAFLWVSLSPTAGGWLREFVNATGAPYEEASDNPFGAGIDLDTDDLVGRYLCAECYHDTYNNKTNNRWRSYEPSAFSNAQAQVQTQIQAQVRTVQSAQPMQVAPRPQPTSIAGQGVAPTRVTPRVGP